MKKTYAACRSYRDSGVVRVRGSIEGGSFGSSVEFATAFVRPAPFRFEFSGGGLGDGSERSVFFWDGEQALALLPGEASGRPVGSLQEALEAAFGITAGASLRVPGLLLPRLLGGGVPLVSPQRLEDDTVNGRVCVRVRGKSRATPYQRTSGAVTVTVEDESVTLWIDRERLLLLKVEEDAQLSTYRALTVTTYSPEVDVPIPPENLSLSPTAPP